MVALQKPDGGVRGLVMSDVFRRLVGRTLAQQFSGHFNTFCAPFQYALSARAGTEALARAVRIATEASGRTTVLSIDGVGAYDHISRSCMLQGLQSDPILATLSPYVRQFYGEPSEYLFYDAEGEAHHIQQGEGGEQGDPLMPALYMPWANMPPCCGCMVSSKPARTSLPTWMTSTSPALRSGLGPCSPLLPPPCARLPTSRSTLAKPEYGTRQVKNLLRSSPSSLRPPVPTPGKAIGPCQHTSKASPSSGPLSATGTL